MTTTIELALVAVAAELADLDKQRAELIDDRHYMIEKARTAGIRWPQIDAALGTSNIQVQHKRWIARHRSNVC